MPLSAQNPLLEEALACLERGCSFLPVHAGNERDKDPHSALLIRSGLKRVDDSGHTRATWKPLQTVLPTEEQVYTWFSDPRGVGLALVTGQISRRIVVDFDGEAGKAFAHELGVQSHVQTGGGYHWHLNAPPWPVRNLVGKTVSTAPDCVDIRGDGGNAILPPTETRKGPYRYLRDPNDLDDMNDLPVELREALGLVPPVVTPLLVRSGPLPSGQDRYPAERILDWAVQKVMSGEKGGRNDVGYLLAWALFNNGYQHDEVQRVGETYVAQVGHLTLPAYVMDEFQASVRTAYLAPRGEAWGTRSVNAPLIPRSSSEAFEDIFSKLDTDEQDRGAYLLAREWASGRRPVEDAVRFLRLMGHAAAPQTVRRAYTDHERGRDAGGTLTGFLAARRVRYRGS